MSLATSASCQSCGREIQVPREDLTVGGVNLSTLTCSYECKEALALSFVGTCQSCGRYLDVRQHKWCPSPCNGYIG